MEFSCAGGKFLNSLVVKSIQRAEGVQPIRPKGINQLRPNEHIAERNLIIYYLEQGVKPLWVLCGKLPYHIRESTRVISLNPTGHHLEKGVLPNLRPTIDKFLCLSPCIVSSVLRHRIDFPGQRGVFKFKGRGIEVSLCKASHIAQQLRVLNRTPTKFPSNILSSLKPFGLREGGNICAITQGVRESQRSVQHGIGVPNPFINSLRVSPGIGIGNLEEIPLFRDKVCRVICFGHKPVALFPCLPGNDIEPIFLFP